MKYTMNVAEARDRLILIADALEMKEAGDWPNEIRAVVAECLHRAKPAKKVARQTSRKMTPELALMVRYHANENPHLSAQQLADHFNVNPGRVSEALQGLR